MLSAEYDADEVFMQSTDVNRTMQSGYSQLMGLYPPSKESGAAQLTPEEIRALDSGRAMPPFRVRDAAVINKDLGVSALPNDFAGVPILVFANEDIHDDCSYDGC